MSKLDPTRTTTLRQQYSAEMRRRFYALRSLVIQAIWKQDALGLNTDEPMTFNQLVSNAVPEKQAWRFQTDAQKLTAFQQWFQQQVDEQIMEVDATGNPWTAKYVNNAYKKGSIRAYTDAHADELVDDLPFYEGKRAGFLESAFAQPERVSKIQFLYQRSFQDLKGITNHMSLQLGRTLAEGMSQGLSPRAIAAAMSKNITSLTKTRALTMARTEVVAAHAEGQLDSFEELNIEEVGVFAEWSTADDEKVCPLCRPMDGTVFKVSESRGLIPRHPNCRCAWIPANVGEKDVGRAWTKKQKQENINKSLKAGLPKKTQAGKKVPQTVREGEKRSTWAGKDTKLTDGPGKADRFTEENLDKAPKKPAPQATPKAEPKAAPAPKKKSVEYQEATTSTRDADGFLDPEKMSKWTDKNLAVERKAFEAWTEDERKAFGKYKVGDYEGLNRTLRSGAVEEKYEAQVKAMDRAMKPLSKPTQTYRGVEFEQGGTLDGLLKPGAEFVDDGFISTSLDERLAASFTEDTGEGAVFVIRVPSGHKVSYLDFKGDDKWKPAVGAEESELLLKRGSKFRVVERKPRLRTEYDHVDTIVLEVVE